MNNIPQLPAALDKLRDVALRLNDENIQLKSTLDTGLAYIKVPENTDAHLLATGHHPLMHHEHHLDLEPTGDNPTHIMLLEGDNISSLTALQTSHAGKVHIIYIDPPYNTGQSSLGYQDRRLHGTGTRIPNSPLRHSAWLSFMERRLRLAHHLLADDGVLFVSIDDTEHPRLRILLDAIFGPTNFIATAIRTAKNGAGSDSKYLIVDHDYVLAYRKTRNLPAFTRNPVDVSSDRKYRYDDPDHPERGKYYLREFQYRSARGKPSTWTIELPNGEHVPSDYNGKTGNEWRWGKKKFQWGIDNDYIVFKETAKGWKIYMKQYQYADNNGNIIERSTPTLARLEHSNSEATTELKRILGPRQFSYPKPVSLIKHLVRLHPNTNAVVLDFFAGSGTTGHAVAELNAEDGGNRTVILATNNEGGEKNPEEGIARRVARTRLERVLTGKNWADNKEHPPVPGKLEYYRVNCVPGVVRDEKAQSALEDLNTRGLLD